MGGGTFLSGDVWRNLPITALGNIREKKKNIFLNIALEWWKKKGENVVMLNFSTIYSNENTNGE